MGAYPGHSGNTCNSTYHLHETVREIIPVTSSHEIDFITPATTNYRLYNKLSKFTIFYEYFHLSHHTCTQCHEYYYYTHKKVI